MKNLVLLMMMLLSVLACSDSESDQVDPILGTWEGSTTQPGFGTFSIVVSLNDLTEDLISGQASSEVTDLSECDEELFYCEIGSCTTTWTYKGRSGSLYYFFEDAPTDSSCGDGNITASILDNGDLSFTWTEINNSTNTSTSILSKVN